MKAALDFLQGRPMRCLQGRDVFHHYRQGFVACDVIQALIDQGTGALVPHVVPARRVGLTGEAGNVQVGFVRLGFGLAGVVVKLIRGMDALKDLLARRVGV